MNIISILGIVGLVGLGIGLWSHVYLNRFKKSLHATPGWKKLRIAVVIFGLTLGALSWPCTYLMGYPFTHNGEIHRIVGIPFMAASFDSKGHDYVGPITLIGVLGNCGFWYFVPQALFALYTKQRDRRTKDN